jgi:hypothetical protein
VFVDVETNGLDPRVHDAWEVAWWNITTGTRGYFLPYIPEPSRFLAVADRKALRVSRFIDRWDDLTTPGHPSYRGYGRRDTEDAIGQFITDTVPGDWRTHGGPAESLPRLIASKPEFDMAFLSKLFRASDVAGGEQWYHHGIDLGSYAAGVLGLDILDGKQSLSAAAVAELCGVDPGDHTAEGDVTSGVRCVLLLREAAAQAQARGIPAHAWLRKQPLRGEWIERELLVRDEPKPAPRFVPPPPVES